MPKETRQKEKQTNSYLLIAIVVIFIAVVIASYEAISILLKPSSSGSFATFKSNFNSAQRVAIYATAYNGTILSSTVGCATMIIENIVGSSQAHRNASTIDFFILNQTVCTYVHGLGMSNGTETSVGSCLNMSSSEPTIYINYSRTNSTIIKPDYLYTSGNRLFLSECGIATELS